MSNGFLKDFTEGFKVNLVKLKDVYYHGKLGIMSAVRIKDLLSIRKEGRNFI